MHQQAIHAVFRSRELRVVEIIGVNRNSVHECRESRRSLEPRSDDAGLSPADAKVALAILTADGSCLCPRSAQRQAPTVTKPFLAKFCDIGQRIPTYGHEIGEFPALDRTDGAIPSHHLRIHDGRSANNLGWSHPELDHVFEFLDLSTVGKRSHSSPETNFDAGGDGAPEVWFRHFGYSTTAIFFGVVFPV